MYTWLMWTIFFVSITQLRLGLQAFCRSVNIVLLQYKQHKTHLFSQFLQLRCSPILLFSFKFESSVYCWRQFSFIIRTPSRASNCIETLAFRQTIHNDAFSAFFFIENVRNIMTNWLSVQACHKSFLKSWKSITFICLIFFLLQSFS